MNSERDDELSEADLLRRLLSERQIYDAVVRYCRGIDRRDRALVLSSYHPDATDNHGVYVGDAVGFVDHSVEYGWREYDSLLHCIANHIVDFDSENVAHSEAYVIAHHLKLLPAGRPRLDLVYGRYVDRFERRSGKWKIAHRVFVHEWSETSLIDDGWLAETRFVRGLAAPDDLAYGMKNQGLATSHGDMT